MVAVKRSRELLVSSEDICVTVSDSFEATEEADYTGFWSKRPKLDDSESLFEEVFSPSSIDVFLEDISGEVTSSSSSDYDATQEELDLDDEAELEQEQGYGNATDYKCSIIGHESDDSDCTDDESFVPRPTIGSKTVPGTVRPAVRTMVKQKSLLNKSASQLRSKLTAGPALGQWLKKVSDKSNSFGGSLTVTGVEPASPDVSASPSLSSASSPETSTADLDDLLEEFVDINSAVDNTFVSSQIKCWTDRYMTIPICGYLNRGQGEAKSFSKVSALRSSVLKRNRLPLTAMNMQMGVAGLKKRSLFTGKGKEMVGLGVMVGDLLL
ncbi:hypothetical protein V1511DRAFT_508990 [Dipodascopsis uninucleata]